MRYSQLRKILNRNAVTLALEFLAGDDSLGVVATAKQLAPLARRSVDLTARVLREMEHDGLIRRLDWRDGISCQVFVLMDRPGAEEFLKEQCDVHGDRRRRNAKSGKSRTGK